MSGRRAKQMRRIAYGARSIDVRWRDVKDLARPRARRYGVQRVRAKKLPRVARDVVYADPARRQYRAFKRRWSMRRRP
jgi:hypothetical protein